MKYEIWYRLEPTFRADPFLKISDIPLAFAKVRTIEADNLEKVFYEMQGEVWSPNGEMNGLIKKLGLHHTSMSAGDVAHCIDNDTWSQCAWIGWEDINHEKI